MTTAMARSCARVEALEQVLMRGPDTELSSALSELRQLSSLAWQREPTTFADLRERALIARACMDRDESGEPLTDCELSRAVARLIEAVLLLTAS